MDHISKALASINNSRLFAGIAMIALNIGSKYITLDLTPAQEKILKENLGRQMLVFAISWMGSRDVITALLLTAAFHILTMYVLNENSDYCVLPESYKEITKAIDTDGDGKISEDEINNAIKVLENYRKNEEKKVQQNMLNSFNTNNNFISFSSF